MLEYFAGTHAALYAQLSGKCFGYLNDLSVAEHSAVEFKIFVVDTFDFVAVERTFGCPFVPHKVADGRKLAGIGHGPASAT